MNEKSFDFLSTQIFPFSKSWPKMNSLLLWNMMIHADFIWWKSLLLCYSEALHKSFHHCQPSSSPKKWFWVPKNKMSFTHIMISNILWLNQGSLNSLGLVKFCCYFQNKVSHETGLPCPPPLWTKTKNCPKDKSHLPQHHHSSHWVQSPIKSVLR